MASFIGAFSYLAPVPLFAVVLLFILLVAWTRYLSLGSVVAAGLFPFACWMILHPDWPVLAAAIGAAILVIWRHADNIKEFGPETSGSSAYPAYGRLRLSGPVTLE